MQDDISGWTAWSAAFSAIPELNSPAELHGLLMGVLTVVKAPSSAQWQQILDQLGFEPLADDALTLLCEEGEDTAAILADDDLDYVPMLPDDDHPLSERVTALADWCGGVLLGFGLAGGQPRPDENELLRDLQDMSSIDFAEDDDDEEGEESYADLVEFARLIPISLSTGRVKVDLAQSAMLKKSTIAPKTGHVVEMFQPERPS